MYSLGISGQQNLSRRESKIGGFDFSLELITDQKLISLYGKGCVDEDYTKHPDHYQRMYFFPEKNMYAAFDIGTDNLVVGLKLTTEPIASINCKAVNKLRNYETGQGINMGDLREKVIKLYGNPSEEKIRSNNIILYRYYVGREEGTYMEIEFFNNKVVSTWVTVGD